ncbi:MAG TPA: hypothetical protein VGG33_13515, partial [Polyangia bacterium]
MARVPLLGVLALSVSCRAFAPPQRPPTAPDPALTTLPMGVNSGDVVPPPLNQEVSFASGPVRVGELGVAPGDANAASAIPAAPPPDPEARKLWLKARLDEVGSQPGLTGAKVGM